MIKGHGSFSPGPNRLQEGAHWLAEWDYRAELDSPPDDPELLQKWHEWSSVDGNTAEADKLASTMRNIKNCTRPPMPSELECSMDEYDGSVPVQAWLARNRNRDDKREISLHHRPDRQRTWLAGTVAVAACALVGVAVYRWQQQPPIDPGSTYATKSGENRKFDMPDGSSITLGAKTTLTAHYTDRQRIIVLKGGESLFRVVHDPQRPFTVFAGGGRIEDIGTSFNVSRDGDRVVVTVIDGSVDVSPSPPSAEDPGAGIVGAGRIAQWKPMHLTAGQRVSYSKNGEVSEVASADLKMTTSWRDGRLQYKDENLRHVFADVNRYWNRQIIHDAETGNLSYTGDILQDDIDAWVRNLHAVFPVEVVDTNSAYVLVQIHRKPASPQPRRDTRPR